MITIVTGLPRSGTSLMMQILKAGGMKILTDNIRQSDVNNPKGYFELEKVKSLSNDNSWLHEAEDKALKVIIQLVQFLPLDYEYNCIIMERETEEIMLSQDKMIENLGGKKTNVDKEILEKTFTEQLKRSEKYLFDNSNFRTVKVNYNELLAGRSKPVEKLNQELSLNLNIKNAISVVDPSLYRSRI